MARIPKEQTATPATPIAPDRVALQEAGSNELVPGIDGAVAGPRSTYPIQQADFPFVLQYHPARWLVLGGHCVPELRKMVLARGLDGVAESGAGVEWRVGAAPRWATRGFTLIENKDGPNGQDYLRRDRVPGGWAHRTCFETFHPGERKITSDFDGYAAWIDELFAKGKLPRPAMHALTSLADRLREEHMNAADLAAQNQPSMGVRAKKILADLEAVESTIEKWRVGVPDVETDTVDI